MSSTFKTILEGDYNNNNNNQDENINKNLINNQIKNEGFYQNKKYEEENNLNEIKKGFFNLENISDEKEDNGIKNFSNKGITFPKNNIVSHLNINVDKLQIKNVDEYLNLKEKSKTHTNRVFKELFDIDNKMALIKSSIINLKRNEMNRLIKEFNMNDYERRFKTTRFIVISALIGEENTNMEITRQNMENKVFEKFFFESRDLLIFYYHLTYFLFFFS